MHISKVVLLENNDNIIIILLLQYYSTKSQLLLVYGLLGEDGIMNMLISIMDIKPVMLIMD